MGDFTSIQRKRTSEILVDEIKLKIESGKFAPDQKLPTEKELCEMFQVGRSTVREALSNLAAIGIIESRQGEGSFIKCFSSADCLDPLIIRMIAKEQETLDLLEARLYIELGTVQLAARRATEEDLMKMKETLQQFKEELDHGKDGMEGDFLFHMAIAEAARNPFLSMLMNHLSSIIRQTLQYTLSQNTGVLLKRRRIVLQEHWEIYEAIQARDPDLAAKKMEFHLDNVRKKIKERSS